jgi:hypothetical protein
MFVVLFNTCMSLFLTSHLWSLRAQPTRTHEQLSNHLAVAIGAGKEDLGGCARVEVFAFSLLDDLDEVLTGFKAASSMSAGAAGLSSSSSRQQQEVSRFQGLPVGGNGFARKGELKKLTFLETPRVRFVTALQV